MAATIKERFEGRSENVSDDFPRAQVPYFIEGVADEDEARTFALENIDEWRNFGTVRMKRTDIQLEMVQEDWSWNAIATYEKKDYNDEGDEPNRSFTTLGGTSNVKQSLETIGSYGPKRADNKGAIGFDGENVLGADIIFPVFEFQETHFKTDSQVRDLIPILYAESAKTNDTDLVHPIIGALAAGEVLFKGASASQRDDNVWEVTYQFSASPNRADFKIGDIDVTFKGGHHFMWFSHEKAVDDAAGGGGVEAMIKPPIAVYVERVYEETDFSDLGLEGWEVN